MRRSGVATPTWRWDLGYAAKSMTLISSALRFSCAALLAAAKAQGLGNVAQLRPPRAWPYIKQ